MDILYRIKRLALARRIVLTRKAQDEMDANCLTEDEVIESIMNAQRIDKTIRSSGCRTGSRPEKLYVIKSFTFSGVFVYTKGKIVKDAESEMFYVLISSKLAI